MSLKSRLVPAALILSLVSLVPVASAMAAAIPDGQISAYKAEATLDGSGVLKVKETVKVMPVSGKVVRTLQTRVRSDADEDRNYDVKNLTATVNGKPAEGFENVESDNARKISVNASGESEVVYVYEVGGVVADSVDGREVSWPIVQGFDASINRANISLTVPFASWIVCFAGRQGSSVPCTSSQLGESAGIEIEQLGIPAGGRLTFLAGLNSQATVVPNADYSTRWSLGRAFTADSSTVGLSALLLGLGILAAAALWFVRGRDAAQVEPVAGMLTRPVLDSETGPQFAAPDGIRPGQVGTVVDETADVVDITATVLDLAVRNYLTIVELPRETEFGRLDWRLDRRNAGGPELLPYEKAVLDAVFADGDSVVVSALGPTLRPRLGAIREHLYADVVTQGWFAQRPDAVRNRWTTAGLALIVAGGVLTLILAIATKFALGGLAVMLAGVALTLAGQVAPARTARGSAVLGRISGLRAYLRDESSVDLPEHHRLEFASRCLPYAAVLGLTDKWALEIANTDDDDDPDAGIGWYSGPENWHLSDIGQSLTNFVTAVSGSLTTSRRLFAD